MPDQLLSMLRTDEAAGDNDNPRIAIHSGYPAQQNITRSVGARITMSGR